MNKRKLYETIIINVSKQLKKVLNESEYDDLFESEAKDALAEYLNLSFDEINDMTYDGNNTFSFGNEEWLIFSDYDDAKEKALEYEIDALSFNPITYVNWNNIPGGMAKYVSTDWFYDCMKESYEAYVDDIRHENASSEDYENRLEEEMDNAGCEDEDEYVEKLCDDWDDPVDYFIKNFGEDYLEEVVKKHNLIDIEKLAEAVIELDGVGSILSSYDGEEVEFDNGFYGYRVN